MTDKNTFLTHEELVEMTEFSQGRAQCRALANMGYTFDVAPSGAPKLLRSAVEARHSAPMGVSNGHE